MNKEIICPHCGEVWEDASWCPDLFYANDPDIEFQKQYEILCEIQEKGYNVVSCGHCGCVFLIKYGE